MKKIVLCLTALLLLLLPAVAAMLAGVLLLR